VTNTSRLILTATTMLMVSAPTAASADVGDTVSGTFAFLVFVAFVAIVIAAIVWFFRGPAKHTNDYVNMLASQIQVPEDRTLFFQIYQNKGPKDVVVAWFLNLFLSPTISC
jgi:cbb3-type cytochrome oxidase subunit 3